MTPSQSPAPIPGRTWFARPVAVVTIPLALAVAAFCVHLAPEWWRNPDLTHGFFIPIACALLLAEARRGPFRWIPATAAWTALQLLAALLAVALFVLAGLIAASLGWSHALCEFLLAGSVAMGLVAGLLALAGDGVRFVPLNWAAATACGIWIFAAPLPSGTYARLTTLLQGEITTNVLHVLHLLGIPAQQRGNVLELASTTVGVAEACSGVRSLLSCIFAGIFFAGWHVRAPGRRVVLLVAAPLLALLMNLLRSLTLTLMANAGWSIEGFWHDTTGFAILLGTAVILFFLAEKLSDRRATSPVPTEAPSIRRM
ncbi:MAG TPA: exosortase/archaeosortase family protein, partial [Candidatus Didemnitutus sp.]